MEDCGGMAERLKAAVLKTAEAQASVGSNPTPSARLGGDTPQRWGGTLLCAGTLLGFSTIRSGESPVGMSPLGMSPMDRRGGRVG